jgi:hypothetical protein
MADTLPFSTRDLVSRLAGETARRPVAGGDPTTLQAGHHPLPAILQAIPSAGDGCIGPSAYAADRGCPATLAIKCVAGLAEGSGRGSDAGFSIRKSTPSAKPSLSPVKRMVSALLKKLNGDSR